MLIKFSVGNFLSFKEEVCLEMDADSLKEKKGNVHIPYLYDFKKILLKSMAIYGHNSHGKTNFIKAYAFFQQFILTSFNFGQTNSAIPVKPFSLNTVCETLPSHFESTFIIKNVKYRYGFKVTRERVIAEWLYYAEAGIRENNLFFRVEQEFRETSKLWNKESGNKIDQSKLFTKPHNLFLSVLISQHDIPRAEPISHWFKGNVIMIGNYGSILNNGPDKIYSKPEYRAAILKFVEAGDLGFSNIFDKVAAIVDKGYESDMINFWFETEKSTFNLYTTHLVYNQDYQLAKRIEFELSKNESSGSIKYFIVSCYLSYAIKNSQLIWIDELDSSLHTNLLILLLKIFNDPKNNSAGAQLIFTTHNTALLDKQLRRDQFVFIQKNKYSESEVVKMHTSKTPIRIEKSIEKEYRNGELKSGVSEKVIKGHVPNLFDENKEV